MSSIKQVHEMARLIHHAAWAVKGLKYSTRKGGDWRSRDAQRAAEYILQVYDVKKKAPVVPNGQREAP